MKVFALLYEPANYTIDRNRAVYEPLGIKWAYLYGQSFAQREGERVESVAAASLWQRLRFAWKTLRSNDVVILNGYSNSTNILFFLLNFVLRRPIGIDSDTPLSIPSNRVARAVKSMYLHLLFPQKWCYGLAGGTKAHKDLFRHYGMKEERIFLSPMMVYNERYKPTSVQEEKKGFRFLYVGRLVECKNLRVLLAAFKQAFQGNPAVELRVVGDGDLREELQAAYQAQTNISFAGRKSGEELVREYHQADVFVLPSSYEPWGLVVNEAMAAGLPVIVSDKVGARYDLVEDKGTGFIFPYDSGEALEERMKLLYKDNALRKQCAEAAYNLMHQHWNYRLYRQELEHFLTAAYDKNVN